MIKAYVRKSLFQHATNHLVGIIFLILFILTLIWFRDLIGLSNEYNILESTNDMLSFFALSIILFLMILQAQKGYLLYLPSTYLKFDLNGISFQMLKKEYRFIKWSEILAIDLSIESEWFLGMTLRMTDESTLRVDLTELWLLSVTKRLCVKHNFLKLSAFANVNQKLREKLKSDQVEAFNELCQVK